MESEIAFRAQFFVTLQISNLTLIFKTFFVSKFSGLEGDAKWFLPVGNYFIIAAFFEMISMIVFYMRIVFPIHIYFQYNN